MKKIQERALRLLHKDTLSTYEELLRRCKESTLLVKRKRLIALEVFKSINDLNPKSNHIISSHLLTNSQSSSFPWVTELILTVLLSRDVRIFRIFDSVYSYLALFLFGTIQYLAENLQTNKNSWWISLKVKKFKFAAQNSWKKKDIWVKVIESRLKPSWLRVS